MPFGLIYGAIFFGILCPWLGLGFLRVPWAPARAAGVLLIVLGISLAAGLLLRQRAARASGVVVAALLTITMLLLAITRGEVMDYLLLIASVAAAVLLAIPATGNVGTAGSSKIASIVGRLAVASMVGLAVVAVWAFVAEPPAATRIALGPEVDWQEFGPGLQTAKAEGKPVFVDFFAEWCGPCKEMDQTTFRDPEVVSRLGNIVAVRIDSEETRERHGYVGLELAEHYDVGSYPTVALLDSEGNLISKLRGYQGPGRFIEWLESAVAESAATPADTGES